MVKRCRYTNLPKEGVSKQWSMTVNLQQKQYLSVLKTSTTNADTVTIKFSQNISRNIWEIQ